MAVCYVIITLLPWKRVVYAYWHRWQLCSRNVANWRVR